jgi:hypothetical protein
MRKHGVATLGLTPEVTEAVAQELGVTDAFVCGKLVINLVV